MPSSKLLNGEESFAVLSSRYGIFIGSSNKAVAIYKAASTIKFHVKPRVIINEPPKIAPNSLIEVTVRALSAKAFAIYLSGTVFAIKACLTGWFTANPIPVTNV